MEKILFQNELFGHDQLLLQFGVGTMPHAKAMRAIELLGTEVAPLVRAEVGRRATAARRVGSGRRDRRSCGREEASPRR